MGIFQQAYITYNAMEKEHMGIYPPEKGEPLCPISHIITSSQVEITIDAEGNFLRAAAVDKSEPKIIIPATEESAGRSGTKAIERPHPLCDMLKYIVAENQIYISNLQKWADSEYTHPKVKAVYKYVIGGTILSDLEQFNIRNAQDSMIRWRIMDFSENEPEECWKDRNLFAAYIHYYAEQKNGAALCMISGEEKSPAIQHPKGIVAINGNAKLVSANDTSGFTFRGRFSEDWQAVTVSYEASQKAHAALRWIITNQGELLGGRTFICWNPEGIRMRSPKSPLHPSSIVCCRPSGYRTELKKALLGEKEGLPEDAHAVIASFDAATTGRLSLTYFNNLLASDFLDRLHMWDSYCCWWIGGKIYAPHLHSIVNCAYGIERNGFLETDDRVMAQQFQRLLACRVEQAQMPLDILHRLVNRASTPQMYSQENWRKIVFTACAVIQKYEEENCMEWSLDKKDRSFQFGRLLAIMERAEADYYYSTGDDRQTNAIKSLAAFNRTPWNVYVRVNERLENAYLPRISSNCRKRYYKLRDEITANLSEFSAEQLNKPLDPFYLMGYELQRNVFFNTNNTEEEE